MAKGKITRKNNRNNGDVRKTNTSNKMSLRSEKSYDIKEDLKNVDKNKKQKNKTISKARKELVYANNSDSNELSKLIKIVLIVTGILIVFYGVTVFVTRKVEAVKTAKLGKSENKAEIQYDSIIIGSMYAIEGEHYVLIEKTDDIHLEEYENLIKTVKANDEAAKVYTADLESSFNKAYLGKENNYDSDLSNFKVTGTTLVEIGDNMIKDTYDTYDSIKKKLDSLK